MQQGEVEFFEARSPWGSCVFAVLAGSPQVRAFRARTRTRIADDFMVHDNDGGYMFYMADTTLHQITRSKFEEESRKTQTNSLTETAN